MAADKEIMKQIETLRLDRPGRVHRAAAGTLEVQVIGEILIAALSELAATYREEAALWSRSGAKGWKSSEAEKFLVAQHIDEVASRLDNAGGGAALSVGSGSLDLDGVSTAWDTALPDDIEAELRESAKRVDAVTTLAGLDKLIADAKAERRGELRERLPRLPIGPNATVTIWIPDDVTAYLKGEIDDIPGTPPLTPGSVTSAPEADDPFAKPVETPSLVGQLDETLQHAAPYCFDCDHDMHRCGGCGEPLTHDESMCAACKILYADTVITPEQQTKLDSLIDHPIPVTTTWESDTMTADGLRKLGAASAPLLGQPGDAGTGYNHAYIPAGGRKVTYEELLWPIPAASLPAHLSNSQGNTIGDCATKYRLQRVEALPQVPQWANVGGSAFHAAVEAIERTMVNAAQAGRTLKLDSYDVELGWKEHFEAEIARVSASSPVPVSVWRASRKGAEGRAWWEVNGPHLLRRYLAARPTDPTAIGLTANEVPAIELELKVDVPTPYGPLPYHAILDRVTVMDVPPEVSDDFLVVRDYKTGYERPTDTTQLGDYAHVLRLGGVPESVRIMGTYFDARRGTWTPSVDLLAAHPFEAFVYRVTTAHAQKRALTTGPTSARPSSYCGGCSVRYACPIMGSRS